MKIERLNYNDLAFFAGISTTEAKIEIARILGIPGLERQSFLRFDGT